MPFLLCKLKGTATQRAALKARWPFLDRGLVLAGWLDDEIEMEYIPIKLTEASHKAIGHLVSDTIEDELAHVEGFVKSKWGGEWTQEHLEKKLRRLHSVAIDADHLKRISKLRHQVFKITGKPLEDLRYFPHHRDEVEGFSNMPDEDIQCALAAIFSIGDDNGEAA